MVEVDRSAIRQFPPDRSLLGNDGLLDHEEMAVPLDDALDLLVLVVGGDEEPRRMRTDVGVLQRRETDGVDAGDIRALADEVRPARISPSARKYS